MTAHDHTEIADYCQALQSLTIDNIDDLLELCHEAIEFRDPFNHTHTRDHFRLALEHMFKHVKDLRFDVTDRFGSGSSWIIKWTFSGRTKFVGDIEITGLSEIELDSSGKVRRHIDYWDAYEGLLQKIPGLGAILRRLFKPLSVV